MILLMIMKVMILMCNEMILMNNINESNEIMIILMICVNNDIILII